jgi:acetyl esterase
MRMGLDPQAEALLDQITAMGGFAFEQLSVAEARAAVAGLAAVQGRPEAIARVDDRRIPGPQGDIPIRIYHPGGAGRLPVLVYFHGGGWVLGSIDMVDGICRSLANGAGCMVVSVDYRLAPEHKFPAAAEDSYAATCWVAEHAAALGVDAGRLAVGGDSAGGNLAAVVTLMARDRGRPEIVHQLLVYPVTDSACDTPSYRANAHDYLLTKDAMLWFWDHYTNGAGDRSHPYAAPLRASNLLNLPPALVITAEYDPLRDEGEAYATRLRECGVPVEVTRYRGMIHGFFGMAGALDQGRHAIDQAAMALRKAFK